MKAKLQPEELLKQMAAISRMERGKLCPMGAGTYYNHQTWEKGRNVVRYVPHQRMDHLQEAIAGYQQYIKLTQAYADEIIRRTRAAQPTKSSGPARKPKKKRPKSL